jgi:hypothetical protein
MIVYGDPTQHRTAAEALAQTRAACGPGANAHERLIELGRLEQALADADDADAGHIARATDVAAELLLDEWEGVAPSRHATASADVLASCRPATEASLTIKRPEGFAFYTLYPEQYALAARAWLRWQTASAGVPGRVAVVGVRSIGTTLSAVVRATLRRTGVDAFRFTTRPAGHPFAREATVDPALLRGVTHALVCDEGPGLSGSSMAAVAEALERAGVAPDRVAFVPGHGHPPGHAASDAVRARWQRTPRFWCTLSPPVAPPPGTPGENRGEGKPHDDAASPPREPNAHSLHAPGSHDREPATRDTMGSSDGTPGEGWGEGHPRDHPTVPPVVRWRGRTLVESLADRTAALLGERVNRIDDLGGGQWRRFVDARAPAFVAFERSKYRVAIASGRALLWKFAGLDADGAADAFDRAASLAHRGWTPAPVATHLGFVATPWIDAPVPTEPDLDAIARYIADAARLAGASLPRERRAAAHGRLRHMLVNNAREALGGDAARAAEALPCPDDDLPRYGDGRLARCDWRVLDGRWIKLNVAGHDADHTVVGPQSVAWDVAGAIEEWDLPDAATRTLVPHVEHQLCVRLGPAALTFHRAAYVAFRLGLCAFAGLDATADRERLRALLSSAAPS